MNDRRPATLDRSDDDPVTTTTPEATTTEEIAGSPTPGESRPERPSIDVATTAPPGVAGEDASATPLFDRHVASGLRDRWDEIQTSFVDEPRSAVERADALVADAMKRLADTFATERRSLEDQWSRGDDVSTEDLRVALRRYRSFFDRLLAM